MTMFGGLAAMLQQRKGNWQPNLPQGPMQQAMPWMSQMFNGSRQQMPQQAGPQMGSATMGPPQGTPQQFPGQGQGQGGMPSWMGMAMAGLGQQGQGPGPQPGQGAPGGGMMQHMGMPQQAQGGPPQQFPGQGFNPFQNGMPGQGQQQPFQGQPWNSPGYRQALGMPQDMPAPNNFQQGQPGPNGVPFSGNMPGMGQGMPFQGGGFQPPGMNQDFRVGPPTNFGGNMPAPGANMPTGTATMTQASPQQHAQTQAAIARSKQQDAAMHAKYAQPGWGAQPQGQPFQGGGFQPPGLQNRPQPPAGMPSMGSAGMSNKDRLLGAARQKAQANGWQTAGGAGMSPRAPFGGKPQRRGFASGGAVTDPVTAQIVDQMKLRPREEVQKMLGHHNPQIAEAAALALAEMPAPQTMVNDQSVASARQTLADTFLGPQAGGGAPPEQVAPQVPDLSSMPTPALADMARLGADRLPPGVTPEQVQQEMKKRQSTADYQRIATGNAMEQGISDALTPTAVEEARQAPGAGMGHRPPEHMLLPDERRQPAPMSIPGAKPGATQQLPLAGGLTDLTAPRKPQGFDYDASGKVPASFGMGTLGDAPDFSLADNELGGLASIGTGGKSSKGGKGSKGSSLNVPIPNRKPEQFMQEAVALEMAKAEPALDEAAEKGKKGKDFWDFMAEKNLNIPLMAMGLAMMGSKEDNFFAALAEGGQAGLSTYDQLQQREAANERLAKEDAIRERQVEIQEQSAKMALEKHEAEMENMPLVREHTKAKIANLLAPSGSGGGSSSGGDPASVKVLKSKIEMLSSVIINEQGLDPTNPEHVQQAVNEATKRVMAREMEGQQPSQGDLRSTAINNLSDLMGDDWVYAEPEEKERLIAQEMSKLAAGGSAMGGGTVTPGIQAGIAAIRGQ